ncbi:MAG: glycosyltransferase family 4 protein [Candidatus Bathyarchaeota archaeon]
MRILFLNHNPEGIGTFFRCLNLGVGLTKLGHDVTIICANSNDKDRRIRLKKRDGVTLILTPRLEWLSNPRRLIDNLIRGIYEFSCSLTPSWDIIHAFTVSQPATAIPAIGCRLFKNSIELVDWDDWWGRGGLASQWGRTVHLIMTFLEEKIPLISNSVTVVSESLRSRALKIGIPPNKVFKIPNGANIDLIKPTSKDAARLKLGVSNFEHVVLYSGSYYNNNLSMLLEAFSQVTKEHSDAALLIIGNISAKHKSLIKNRGISDKVVYYGMVPYHEMPPYLSAADVLALPMRNILVDQGRWPIRLGDYLAAGRSIVSNPVGEAKIVLEETGCGLLARTDDPSDFADKIVSLLSDKHLCEELGRNARQAAENKYAWVKIAQKLECVYTTLSQNCNR